MRLSFPPNLTALLLASLLLCIANAKAQQLTPHQQTARSVFKELIEINTTPSTGNTTLAAEAMAKRLRAAGFPEKDVQVIGPTARNRNLVVRYRGTGKMRPVLFLAHLDVVEARRQDWSLDPFVLTEKDGYFYGRGTMDIKDGDAILVANFIRLKQEGFVPTRDLILALTAGEESSLTYNGVDWLVKNKRSLVDAELCINMDAGDPQMKKGKKILRTVQVSEKGFMTMELETKNPGGHSSLPTKENAIYQLAGGLLKLAAFDFPANINEVTKSFFRIMSSLETGQTKADLLAVANDASDTAAIRRLSASPYYNALMCTTCVATLLQGGHAENALPQSAKATINCRVLPDVPQEEVLQTVKKVLADTGISATIAYGLTSNPASPLKADIMNTIETVTKKLWPGVPVVPVMETGATDGKFLRAAGIPTYGVSGVPIDVDDVRAHGKDERIGVKEFYEGLEYEYQLIKALGKKK